MDRFPILFYDIYFIIVNYPGGIPELVKIFRPVKFNKLAKEGLGKIKAKFKNINSIGPKWIITSQDSGDEEKKNIIRRDAYERISQGSGGIGGYLILQKNWD